MSGRRVATPGRATTRARAKGPTLRFDQRLVLVQYLLALFGVERLEDLAAPLQGADAEGWDAEGFSRFQHLLLAHFPAIPGLTRESLLGYDANIARHTLMISVQRGGRLRWKYFQYLALLCTEIYLDRFFDDPDLLLGDLNRRVAAFNLDKDQADKVASYAPDDLRKLAFWMATGSGKTLLMHVNLLQYRHYLARAGRAGELNRVLLLTPNEALSRQHRDEFARSGLAAELFDKGRSGGLFGSQLVEIIDVHKLADETGEKRVAVESFEGNNLVLVDEGHRGAGGFEWRDYRDRLCAEGFSFEYSATFGQALKAANKPALSAAYARCIAFDYSYRYFYRDGYGKDYQILNLDGGDPETMQRYLTAALLAFYQQMRLFNEGGSTIAPYGIERPLWIFVGGSVTKTVSGRDLSDVTAILRFLARFVAAREESIALLDRLIGGNTGLAYKGRDLFAGTFAPLVARGERGATLYGAILRDIFNAPARASFVVEERKGVEGELALRLGDYPAFGVINVGDARGLARALKSAAEDDKLALIVTERLATGALFEQLNSPQSRVNMLIGSRKFTEGWSSWRVSSMGPMNIGRTEGAQIIQLFGRGVRLKGLNFGLQRSARVPGVVHPPTLRPLETLTIFGVQADYMAQFKEYLSDEGLPSNGLIRDYALPVKVDLPVGVLKTIRLRDGSDFLRDGPEVPLGPPPADFARRPILLDWYPKIQAIASSDGQGKVATALKEEGKLAEAQLAWLDFDVLTADLVRYKRERSWANLTITRRAIEAIVRDPNWYTLTIPAAELAFVPGQFRRRIRLWQELAAALLKKYCERFYKAGREAWEAPRREYAPLEGTNSNFFPEYRFQLDEEREGFDAILTKLNEAREAILADRPLPAPYGPLELLSFDRHLYRPLVFLANKDLAVKPVALNEGERDLVGDLAAFCAQQPSVLDDTTLYLLRNMSAGKGIGFFEAGNFYPDFILWLVAADRQWLTFLDPKGIRNLEGPDDPKIRFHSAIKAIERQLGDPRITLNSFIISNTPYQQVRFWTKDKAEFTVHHVLFQNDDRATYIETMLQMIRSSPRADRSGS